LLHVAADCRALALGCSLLSITACSGDRNARDEGGDAGSTGADSAGEGQEEGEGDATAGDSDGEPFEFVPGEQTLPRLTAQQFDNALTDLFGEGLPQLAVEPDTNPYLFYNIGAASTTLSELGVQQYEEAADIITHFVFDDPARRTPLVGCEPTAPGDACITGFLETFGRRAYRRTLTDVELARWTAIAVDLSEGDAWRGLRIAVAGMLQSPNFLYRAEVGEPDPDDPSRLKYTSFEMASRLSFLLWNTIPDDALLDAAEADALSSKSGIEEQATRMLADPRARAAIQDFFAQYFDLGRLDGIARDPENYPAYTTTLRNAMRTEVQLLVDDFVHRRDGDIRKVFSTRETFVNDELAALYEVDAPGASSVTFVPVTLPEDGPRAGLLTLGAFLTMNAHETETSPTLRGKYVRERVLCDEVPAPPDDVDTDLDPAEQGEGTLRERLDEHRNNPACASCHAFIDPPGFLFENYDSLAQYRTEDRDGNDIDASGDLDGTELANARELADYLAEADKVGYCIVRQLFRHATARLDADSEEEALEDIEARFADADYRFRGLLIELVTHDAFRFVSEQEEEG
jgi:hypothetical protein